MFNLDEEQTLLKALATDMYDTLNKINSLETYEAGTFKLVEGKNDPTTFLPLIMNIGGQIVQNNYAHKKSKYSTEDQARHVYKRVLSGCTIDTNTLKQEIEQK